MNTDPNPLLDVGTWIGREQAFGVLANQSAAAQAECLRNIRDSAAHQTLNLTWNEFCDQYIGLSRPQVDGLIHRLEEFGSTYFRLCEIVRISPATFRAIAGNIQGDSLVIDGQQVPIVPANMDRIRPAVLGLRRKLRRPIPPFTKLAKRMAALIHQCRVIAADPMPPEDNKLMKQTVMSFMTQLEALFEALDP